MTPGTWDLVPPKGILRAVTTTFFALALVLALAAPALAQEDAPPGFYAGFVVDADEDEQWILADGVIISQEQFEEWFDSEDEELPEGEDFEGFFFDLFEDDDYFVNFEESDKEHFLCVAVLNLEDNLFAANYDPEEGSTFGIWVEDDECPEEEPEPEPEEEEHEEPPPAVTPAERVDTGAGGTAGGFGAFALLFGLIAAAGATVLRKGSATS